MGQCIPNIIVIVWYLLGKVNNGFKIVFMYHEGDYQTWKDTIVNFPITFTKYRQISVVSYFNQANYNSTQTANFKHLSMNMIHSGSSLEAVGIQYYGYKSIIAIGI